MGGWEVRPTDPRRARRLRLAFAVMLLAIPLAFYLGTFVEQGAVSGWSNDGSSSARQDEAELQPEVEMLQQRLAVVTSGERVAQQANEQSRLTIKLLEEQIFKLQQDLASYKSVLAPASRREGLRIQTFEVQPTEVDGRFRYKLLLSRVGPSDQPLQGALQVTIIGRQGEKPVSLELAPLTEGLADALSEQTIVFSFKHFQAIPEAARFGELAVPDGFVPEQVKVQAQVEGEQALVRTFKWLDTRVAVPDVE